MDNLELFGEMAVTLHVILWCWLTVEFFSTSVVAVGAADAVWWIYACFRRF